MDARMGTWLRSHAVMQASAHVALRCTAWFLDRASTISGFMALASPSARAFSPYMALSVVAMCARHSVTSSCRVRVCVGHVCTETGVRGAWGRRREVEGGIRTERGT